MRLGATCLIVVLLAGVPSLPAPDAPPEPSAPEGGRWYAGDMHSHLSPPDPPGHSRFDLAGAMKSARRNGLEWLVITPHRSDARAPDTGRSWQARLAAEATELTKEGGPLVLIGLEADIPKRGHLGISFTDVAALPNQVTTAHLKKVARAGGIVVVNHPFLTPASLWEADNSWQPWTGNADPLPGWTAIEVHHIPSVLVEGLLGWVDLDARPHSRTLARWDREIREGRRQIPGVGGSDSHGKFPSSEIRPTTWVWLEKLEVTSLHDALREGRICLGGPEAGSLTATSDIRGEHARIGGTLHARNLVRLRFEGRARVFVSGEDRGVHEGGFVHRLSPPGSFQHYRIVRDGSFSNPIYANCP